MTSTNLDRRRWLAAMLLGGLISLAWVPWLSRAKLESSPAGALTVITQTQTAPGPLTAGAADDGSQALTAACVPFADVVPSQDGTELFISINGFDESCGTICVNSYEGPGVRPPYGQRCCTEAPCFVTFPGLTPGMGISASFGITSSLGLDAMIDFNRAYVPASTIQTINSTDGNLQLTLVSTDTITFDTYVAVVPNYAPPAPAPPGQRFVGSTCSVRAAGALLATDKPMSLHLYYHDTTLAGADPHTLAIFAWDAFHRRWDDLGGQLFYDQGYLAVATSRFTTYALMVGPGWRDEFADTSGLNLLKPENVTLIGPSEDRALVLESAPGRGGVVSQPITPTVAIAAWDSLTFTRTIDSPTTTLTVDVLSLDGVELLSDVASGISLAGLAPAQYPALKLRATLSSTAAGETPALDAWQLTWHIASSPPPTIRAVSPLSASNHVTTTLTVSGSGFFSATQIRLDDSITLPVVTFVTSQTLQGLVPPGLSPGTHDVTVINPDGQSGTLPGGFTVVPPRYIYLPLVLHNRWEKYQRAKEQSLFIHSAEMMKSSLVY